MYSRIITIDNYKSFFLLGPRGTGKSTWTRQHFPNALIFDLLDAGLYNELLARPQRLADLIPTSQKDWVIIDGIQRIPELLNTVHSLIERRSQAFVLTGSSARKLRRGGANLLAGRALTHFMYPLTAKELGGTFDLNRSLLFGHLPSIFSEPDPAKYLASYVQTYLREEIMQEGLTRNLAAFSRFLSAASFSQASLLNISDVARDAEVERKVVENYFSILEDLLIGERIPVFSKRAKRKVIAHPKFYFFDVGVYRALRPSGPLDNADVIPGAALETLVYQELRAINHYIETGYEMYFWRTPAGLEVDFVLYGQRGIIAIEVKSSSSVNRTHLRSLLEFKNDYPLAKCYLIYGGEHDREIEGISILSASKWLPQLDQLLLGNY